MKLDVVSSPRFLDDRPLSGWLCAVVDVLRATTTMITALASGALEVRPCLDAAEARARAKAEEDGLLGGEEDGLQIEGFDLGNSPLDYLNTKMISGKTVFLYTTNGTSAIRHAYSACGVPVHIAALVNVSAASVAMAKAAIGASHGGLAIVCSGRCGALSAEDLFCAGLMTDKIDKKLKEAGVIPELSDSAQVAAGFAAAHRGQTITVLRSSEHGQYLASIGFGKDISFASEVDKYDLVAIFDGERVVPAPR